MEREIDFKELEAFVHVLELRSFSKAARRLYLSQPTVSGYIARIEHFCVGVNQNIYDHRTVYALAHGYLDGQVLKRRMEPIIDKKQLGASEDYYENIHAVLSWMEKESQKRK